MGTGRDDEAGDPVCITCSGTGRLGGLLVGGGVSPEEGARLSVLASTVERQRWVRSLVSCLDDSWEPDEIEALAVRLVEIGPPPAVVHPIQALVPFARDTGAVRVGGLDTRAAALGTSRGHVGPKFSHTTIGPTEGSRPETDDELRVRLDRLEECGVRARDTDLGAVRVGGPPFPEGHAFGAAAEVTDEHHAAVDAAHRALLQPKPYRVFDESDVDSMSVACCARCPLFVTHGTLADPECGHPAPSPKVNLNALPSTCPLRERSLVVLWSGR